MTDDERELLECPHAGCLWSIEYDPEDSFDVEQARSNLDFHVERAHGTHGRVKVTLMRAATALPEEDPARLAHQAGHEIGRLLEEHDVDDVDGSWEIHSACFEEDDLHDEDLLPAESAEELAEKYLDVDDQDGEQS